MVEFVDMEGAETCPYYDTLKNGLKVEGWSVHDWRLSVQSGTFPF